MENPRMHRFSDPARFTDGSRKRRRRCCLPLVVRASAPRRQPISGLDSPAYAYPYRRFAAALTDDHARLGATVDRYSFDVELSHLLLHAGLSRRLRTTTTPPSSTAHRPAGHAHPLGRPHKTPTDPVRRRHPTPSTPDAPPAPSRAPTAASKTPDHDHPDEPRAHAHRIPAAPDSTPPFPTASGRSESDACRRLRAFDDTSPWPTARPCHG